LVEKKIFEMSNNQLFSSHLKFKKYLAEIIYKMKIKRTHIRQCINNFKIKQGQANE